MKIREWLTWATVELRQVNSERSGLEARLLLAHALGCSPQEVVPRDHEELPFSTEKKLRELVDRRQKYEPIAYILGKKEFFGIDFQVSRDVLIPRPESEALVEEVLRWTQSRKLERGNLIDLGTGSGCLVLSLARHLPSKFNFFAMDISESALSVARNNASLQEAPDIEWIRADFLKNSFGAWSIIVSNPPYIPSTELEDLQPDIRYYEPRVALDGGGDGMYFMKGIGDVWLRHLAVPGLLAIETHGKGQVEDLRSWFEARFKGRVWSIGPHFFYEAV